MQKKYYLFLLLFTATLLEFWHLGTQPVKSYDEARYAANAFEMLHNRDFINLHYQGQPDTWVARPPLKAWLIIAGYELLGYNEWGLRLSSGLAILVFFFFAFRLINLYLPDKQAFISCMMLLSVKGIIGFHIGRNADMDAELIALLTISTYFFLRYFDFNDTKSIWWTGLFLGIAFWLKTTACFYYIPGLLLYVLVSGKFASTMRSKAFWTGVGIFGSFIFAWFMVLQCCGSTFDPTKNGYHNYHSSWETMLFYDTWDRFTASHFDKHPVEANPLFFIHSIDSLFNIWNYFFYAGILLYTFNSLNKKRKVTFQQSPFYKICTLSICIMIPIIVLLTFGMHKLPWYTSPALLFMAILAAYAIFEISTVVPYTYVIVAALFLFALMRHYLFLEKQIHEKNETFFLLENKALWQPTDTIQYLDAIPQSMYVYLLWQGKIIVPFDASSSDSTTVVMGEQLSFPPYSARLLPLMRSNEEKHNKDLFIARIKH